MSFSARSKSNEVDMPRWVHSKLHSSDGSSSNMDVHQYNPQSPAIVRKGNNQAETYRVRKAPAKLGLTDTLSRPLMLAMALLRPAKS